MRNVRRNAAASVAAATSIAIASVLLLPSTQAGAETVQGLQQSYKDASDRYQALLIESDAASEQLNDANARLDEANANEHIDGVDVKIKFGRIRETIMDDIIFPLHPDLVICGARGLSSFKYALLGSVSTFLVRQCPCDLLVVKQKRDD